MQHAPGHGTRAPAPVLVLLIEGDANGAAEVERVLEDSDVGEFRIEWVNQVATGLERLEDTPFDVILVGSEVDEVESAAVFERISASKPDALLLPLIDGAYQPPAAPDQASAALTKHASAGYWLPHALRYVTQRKLAEAARHAAEEVLFEEKERARVTLSSIGDAVLVTNVRGNVTYINPVGEQLTGWTHDDAVGRHLAEVFVIVDGATRATVENPAERATRQDRTVELESNAILKRFDGSECGIEDSAAPIHDRYGQVTGAVIVFRHVSQSKTVTRKMAHLARHDTLTGLPNRLVLQEHLALAIEQAQHEGRELALLFVDIDDFKNINDSLGHLVGDQVLQGVAARLSDALRASDTVCRIGGDEFVVLLSSVASPADTDRVTEKLRAAFEAPLSIDQHSLSVSISLGVSRYPDEGETINALLERADNAMYEARGYLHRASSG